MHAPLQAPDCVAKVLVKHVQHVRSARSDVYDPKGFRLDGIGWVVVNSVDLHTQDGEKAAMTPEAERLVSSAATIFRTNGET